MEEDRVGAVLALVSPPMRAMIDLQLLTGMLPGEVCQMRTCDLDTRGRLWTYRPAKHKTQHHGHTRTIFLGPRAQAVVAPFLRTELDRPLFSPADAEAWRRERQYAARETPLSAGNKPGSNRVRRPKWQPSDRYTVNSYRRAIAYACEQAFEMPDELRAARGKVKDSKAVDAGTHC